MLRNAVNYGGEYLIYGGHYVEESGTYSGVETSDPHHVQKYVTAVVAAIKSGVFTYIAHPDLINFSGDIDFYKQEMRKICVASRECGIPLEINFLGIRTGRIYPNEDFWEIAGEEKCPVTYGFDAHDPQAACDLDSVKRADELVAKYGLCYIGEPKIIRIDK